MNQIYGRFQQKHDTEANWLKATNFAPLEGEVIIYDADYDAETNPNGYKYPRIKIGIWDGTSEKTSDMLVSNLPFMTDWLEEDTVKHISYIDTWAGVVTDLEITDDEGITWLDNFDIGMDSGNGYNGDIYHRLPITSGKGIVFNLDEHGDKVQISAPAQISTTYAELKQLRDNSELIPGVFYRITDYECTTVQEGTRAMNNKFDIIIQALSSNTISENASADYHYTLVGGTISSQVIESDGALIEDAVIPYYYEYIDFEGGGEGLVEYKTMDGFIAYDYLENNDGQIVPVIYKTDVEAAVNNPDEYGQPDYQDEFYYVGRETIDGVAYDKWRKIFSGFDSELAWESTGKIYLYTNTIVEDTNLPQINGISSNVANIPAWELKYCLDNDIERFAWADNEQGKGVIYFMKDEWNNECPYDFKNIQFQRSVEWQEEHSEFITGLGLAIDDLHWFYTFSYINTENLTVEDLTLKQDLSDDGSEKYGTHDNLMLPFIQNAISIPRITLNNNIMIYCSEVDDGFFYGCYGNSFKNNCYNNTFGNNCYDNAFGNSCFSNTFGNDCFSNAFGNECSSNTFGKYCNFNTFGNQSSGNIFGNYCSYNTFESSCFQNAFGSNCYYNTFGKNCYYNTFGKKCDHNTFGNNCKYNIFGSSIDGLIAYAEYIHFADNCCYVKLLNSESGDSANRIQNITILAGISGTNSSPLELQVSRNAPPVVYEAAGTTHIILD